MTRKGYETEKEATIMVYKGIVKGNVVELEEGVRLLRGGSAAARRDDCGGRCQGTGY